MAYQATDRVVFLVVEPSAKVLVEILDTGKRKNRILAVAFSDDFRLSLYIVLVVDIADDFFEYVNGTWVNATEMPADKSRYGLFDMLRDESQENVKAIIEMSATGDFAKGTDEQKVGDLYKSYLDMETRNARGVEPLQPELDRIAAISDYD